MTAKLEKSLHHAFHKRAGLLTQMKLAGDQCLRIFDGRADGLAELSIDLFGALLVARFHLPSESGSSRGAERQARESSNIESVLRNFCEQLPFVNSGYLWYENRDAKADCLHLYGESCDSVVVQTNGCRFVVRPQVTPSAGLFLDTRSVRSFLLEHSKGKRVLNAFCFTGSLGLAAAKGGADEVVQLDIQKSILAWTRENLELNNISDGVRLICEDALGFLRRELRRIQRGKPRYDLIVIDPPTFGSSGKVRFSLEKSLEELLQLSEFLLSPGGTLIMMCNNARIDSARLREIAERVAPGLKAASDLLPPSEDFPSGASRHSSSMRGVRFTLLAK